MVHILDTRHQGNPGIIAATALETTAGLALFDTGPESTFENLAREIRDCGFETRDVRYVFLSHIHLDHAGAAWRFAELGATVYVHPRGAPHLLDPTKLLQSAARIFGEDMERLWGRLAPVGIEQLRSLENGQVVRIDSLEIRAIATPGHARHHHIYQWENNIFGGDIAGVRLGNGPPIPPFVPPELEVESWRESIAKIRALDPARLYLPHFGLVTDAASTHLDALEERVIRWSEWFREHIRNGDGEQQLVKTFGEYETNELRAAGVTEAGALNYEAADPSYMAVPAAIRYWSKREAAEGSKAGSH